MNVYHEHAPKEDPPVRRSPGGSLRCASISRNSSAVYAGASAAGAFGAGGGSAAGTPLWPVALGPQQRPNPEGGNGEGYIL